MNHHEEARPRDPVDPGLLREMLDEVARDHAREWQRQLRRASRMFDTAGNSGP
jgi:hypothetical protein